MVDMNQNEDNHLDDHVDVEIISCLNLEQLQSFFLFAGAGSGKTKSLVTALNKIRENYYQQLRLKGQRVAVITYTNAACDEISRRLDYDPLFSVSTIHSFVWDLIKGFNKDIREWLYTSLTKQIAELKEEQRKGRPISKVFADRQKSMEAKQKRIENLESIKQFTYNPNGINQDRESLNHSEVISIGSYFLNSKPLMQKILIRKFPVLLVDESQDTNKELINSLFEVEKKNSGFFSLGLFGDTMQRIYSDGKEDLGINLPSNWKQPAKKMNHRCPLRIIKLINKIRSAVDDQEQRARTDKEEGHVHLFISPVLTDRTAVEAVATQRMAEITDDRQWIGKDADFTTLILEHHMAATRLGFSELFRPLYKIDKLRTGLLEGSLAELNFFTEIILPIIDAKKIGDKFAITSIVRKYSPLLKIRRSEKEQLLQIKNAEEAINQLLSLWNEGNDPHCINILQCVAKLNLFDIPSGLYPFTNEIRGQNVAEDSDKENDLLNAWEECLIAPFSQVKAYGSYIKGESKFMTHQGVKGLEFPRVMVIIDDSSAGGFLFSYEKLFGAKEKTKTDIGNELAGRDTTIDRTRRLFYVTCSRAEKSLAIVAYSENPEAVRKHVLEEGWFEESEVEILL